MQGPAHNIHIASARHANFKDFALQDEYISGLLGGSDSGLGVGTIEPELAFEIVHTYIGSFLEHYMNNTQQDWLFSDSPWSQAEAAHQD